MSIAINHLMHDNVKVTPKLVGTPCITHCKQVLFLRDEASGGGCGAHKSFARLEGVHTLRHYAL